MDAMPAVVVADASPPIAAVEATADAAVEVAQIQADRDVAIAETSAETAVELATISADQEDEDVTWLKGELDSLRARCETQEGNLSSVTQALTETQVQVSSLAEMLTLHLNTLTPPAHSPPAAEPIPEPSESAAEDGLKDGGELPQAETKPRRNRNWL